MVGTKPMVLPLRKTWYVEEHFRLYGDDALARALGVNAEAVRIARTAGGFVRTEVEEARVHQNPGGEPPPYTASYPKPKGPRRLDAGDYAVAAAALLASLVLYLRTLAPTVTGEDGGELVTAAYTLGIPHPPGYPLWCLLGKLFTLAVPFGAIAWRVNLMSAVFGALTVAVACLTTIKLTRSRLAGTVAGLVFAVSCEFWKQSVIAEVYTLNAFLIALCTLILMSWYETRRNGALFAFAVVFGLGLCHHKTILLLAPVYAGLVLFVEPKAWLRWRTYAICVMLVMAVVVPIHLYLPIRSLANPPINYGRPYTPGNFIAVVTMAMTSDVFVDNPRTVASLLAEGRMYLGFIAQQFTPWLVWAPVLGLFALRKYDRVISVFLVGFFAFLSVVILLVISFREDFVSKWTTVYFWIPCYMILAILMGCAIECVRTWIPWRGWRTMAAAGLGVVFILVPCAANYYVNDKSAYYFAHDFGTNLLNGLDKGAIFIGDSDHSVFPALYLHAVEGVRPDVVLGNVAGEREPEIYRDMPDEIAAAISSLTVEQANLVIDRWVVTHSRRPVYFTKYREIPGWKLVNAGLVYRAVPEGERVPERDYWSEYKWHTLDPADTRGDLTAMVILSHYYRARGRAYLDKGDTARALSCFEEARRAAPPLILNLTNTAIACARYGLFEAAMMYFQRAFELDPTNRVALYNLGVTCEKRGDLEGALEWFQRIVTDNPGDAEANWLAVDLLRRLGREDAVIAQLEQMADHIRGDVRVYRQLGLAYLKEGKDPERAKEMFRRALALDPTQRDLVHYLDRVGRGRSAEPPGTPQALGASGGDACLAAPEGDI